MSGRERYRCPVCKKALTKLEYERALGILGEREKHLEHQKIELQQQLRDARVKQRQARAEGVRAERARTQRLLAGKEEQIQILKEKLKHLKKGTTPQTDGLEFEDKLTVRLRHEFPLDEVLHKGKGGDVLQHVRFDGKVAGTIIYECKRTQSIQIAHVRQAQRAKRSRDADFAVLVTTGTRRGFSGFASIENVLVVSPLGVVPLATLLRGHIVEMLRAQIDRAKRAQIANELVRFISSPQFRNPIEETVTLAGELQDMIREEAKQHFRLWKQRWDRYQTIQWDGEQIQSNVQLVLHGKRPAAARMPKDTRLVLPPVPE